MRYLLLIIFFVSSTALANDLSLNFDNVTLTELVKVVYGDLKKQDFIIDDDLLKNEKRFTIRSNHLKQSNIKVFLDALLDREGYHLRQMNSIMSISKKQSVKEPYTLLVYTPRYRTSSYILESVKPFMPPDAFNSKKLAIDTPPSQNVNTSGTTAYDQAAYNRDDIVVQGTNETLNKFQMLVQKLDKPVDELFITTYIYEVTNGKDKETGLSLTASLLGEKLGLNLAGSVLENFLSIETLGITAVISALSTDNRYKVLSSPFLRVRDRHQAVFSVGSDVPVIGQVVNNGNGQSTQSIDYRQSGIILDITPRISKEQYELSIRQELSNFVQTTTGVNNSPTLIKRSIDTVVNARDGDVIILGGLDELKTTQSSSGLSFLPFVQSNYTSEDKNSIILVMHVQKSPSI